MKAQISDVDKQKARSRRYGISVRDDGNVIVPLEWEALRSSQWGDPVNYIYPIPDQDHARDAKSRFEKSKGEYDTRSRRVVRSRLNRLLRKHDLDPIGNDDGEENESFSTGHLVGRIQLDSPNGVLIPAARNATLKHPWYGEVYMDTDLFDSFIDNWQSDVLGVQLAIDAEHRRNGMLGGMALAWVDGLFVRDDVFNIHAAPTDIGTQHLGETYKYASIEYHPHLVDQETSVEYGPTLIACAATNHPFVHRNTPIETFENVEQAPSGIFYFVMPDIYEKEDDMPNKEEGIIKEPVVEPAPIQPELPTVSEVPRVVRSLTLPDGQVITAEEVAQLRLEMANTRAQLKQSRIDEICGTASDRGVAPVVIEAARHFLEAAEMDAVATIPMPTGEPDSPTKTVNIFEGVRLFLDLVPGRMGEVTYTPQTPPPPVTTITNPYTQAEELTPEEAEEKARQRRQQLGLNNRQSVEVEL